MRLRDSALQKSGETPSAEIDLVFDARPASLAAIRRAASGAAVAAHLPFEQIQMLQVAIGEAATNSIEHAYGNAGGDVRLRTYRRGPHLCVEITDHGRWREGAPRVMAGRGITIIRALVDHVEIERGASGTTVRLTVKTADDEEAANP